MSAEEIPSSENAECLKYDLSRSQCDLKFPKSELTEPKIFNRFSFYGLGDCYHITFLVDPIRLQNDPSYVITCMQLLHYAFCAAIFSECFVALENKVFLLPISSQENNVYDKVAG